MNPKESSMPKLLRRATGALVIAACWCAMVTVAPASAADPAPTCQMSKLKLAGKYGACRLATLSKARKTGVIPDFTKCDAKLPANWLKTETKAGAGICPSAGDQLSVQDFLLWGSEVVDDALVGSRLPGCTGPAFPLTTEQTTCYDDDGLPIACAGSGQDGELQKGLARSFSDNGDGTIADAVTGLTWEKLSDDGTVHDWNDAFTWDNALTKVAALNAAGFAGHSDWRLPNINELNTLAEFSVHDPATFPIFNAGCVPGCTVLTCSCTLMDSYWSSTTVAGGAGDQAWDVALGGWGNDAGDYKLNSERVRAVRGGE
jgi:Protein of unknown function (DUF1566)